MSELPHLGNNLLRLLNMTLSPTSSHNHTTIATPTPQHPLASLKLHLRIHVLHQLLQLLHLGLPPPRSNLLSQDPPFIRDSPTILNDPRRERVAMQSSIRAGAAAAFEIVRRYPRRRTRSVGFRRRRAKQRSTRGAGGFEITTFQVGIFQGSRKGFV